MPMPKSTVNFSPASPEAAFTPSFCWNSSTRKPSKPAFCKARRYSDSYMPKRHGPHEPAVKKTWLLMISVFRHPARFQALQVLHQVAHGEVRGIALAVVAVLLAQLEGRDVGHRQNVAAISAAFKHRLDHPLVFPGQATEEDGHLVALFRGEGLFDGAMKVADRAAVQAHHACQARTFLRQLPLNLLFGLRTRQFIYGKIDASHGHSNLPLLSGMDSRLLCQYLLIVFSAVAGEKDRRGA